MRTEQFHSKKLVKVFKTRKIVTMAELKKALGTDVDVTVFRKLRELSYRTSYSHRASYYTLDRIARFNELGLWSFRSVWFSAYGTLISTIEVFVSESEAGCYAGELESVLNVGVKDALLKLARSGSISREKVAGGYLYCAAQRSARRRRSKKG